MNKADIIRGAILCERGISVHTKNTALRGLAPSFEDREQSRYLESLEAQNRTVLRKRAARMVRDNMITSR